MALAPMDSFEMDLIYYQYAKEGRKGGGISLTGLRLPY
jgi:hypothetical protein